MKRAIVAGEARELGDEEKQAKALAWAVKATEERRLLFHMRLGVLARAHKAFGPGEFIGPNGRAVMAVVVLFEDGSSSIADPDVFAELTQEGVAFAEKVAEKIADALRWGMIFANRVGLDEPSTMKILIALFQSQILRLQAEEVQGEPEGAPERSGAPASTLLEGHQADRERNWAPIPAPESESAASGQPGPATGPTGTTGSER